MNLTEEENLTRVLALIRNKKTHTEPLSRKKKIELTGDSMVNDISEKGVSVNYKVKVANFPVVQVKRSRELDDIVKEKPDDLIVHAGTNDITDNVNLSTLKKSSIKSSTFHLSLTAKVRRTSRTLAEDTNCRLKNFCMQKEISFIDNSGIKEFHFGKRKLHLNKQGKSVVVKILIVHAGTNNVTNNVNLSTLKKSSIKSSNFHLPLTSKRTSRKP